MKKHTQIDSSNAARLAVLGATLAGLAGTAYFFFGPHGKKNQRDAKAWAIKMKADVIEKLEEAREVSEPTYNKIIDAIAEKYEKGRKANGKEIQELAGDLKKHWSTITKAVLASKKDVVASAKKVAKKNKKILN